MLFHNLFLLILFLFQLVAALPLTACGKPLDGQHSPKNDNQLDSPEGLLGDTTDQQLDHQIDRQPDEPPPGLSTQPPQLSTDVPFQLSPSQPTTAQAAAVTIITKSLKQGVTKTCILTFTQISKDQVLEVEDCTTLTALPAVSGSVTSDNLNPSTTVSLTSSTYFSESTSSSSYIQTSSSASSAITTSSVAVSSTSSSSVQTSSSDIIYPSAAVSASSSVQKSSSVITTSSAAVSTSSSMQTSASATTTSSAAVVSTSSSSVRTSSSDITSSSAAVSTSSSSVQTSSSDITSSSAAVSTSSSSVQTSSSDITTSSAAVSTSSSSIQTSPENISTSSEDVPLSSSATSTSSSFVPTSSSSVEDSVPSSVGVQPNSFKVGGTSSAHSTSTSLISGTVAAANATADRTVPGRKLSVLPIGLGVFAGISVIALVVVGLVTYERTKYRKAFRQRKLAESGAAMGYGGRPF